MRKYIICVSAIVLLAGCTTPKSILKNPKTGQVATCGGDVTSSLAGGVVGYHIQKANDEKCETDYLNNGFKRVDYQE